jgi:hypothetical protein
MMARNFERNISFKESVWCDALLLLHNGKRRVSSSSFIRPLGGKAYNDGNQSDFTR